MYKKTNLRGSALVFALVVMFIILTAALGVASVSVIDQRNSSTSGKSSQSFQVADSAVETVLKQAVTDPLGTTLGLLGSCADGVVTLSGLPGGSSAQVSFRDAFGNDIKNGVVIDGITYNNVCSTINLSQVAEVKAVATYGDTTRAISAAVAAGSLNWISAEPLMINGWHDHDDSPPKWIYPVKYAKDSRTGLVYLRGMANNHTSVGAPPPAPDSVVLTLPDGFRPLGRIAFPIYNHQTPTTPARMDILSDGQVVIVSTSASVNYAPFEGIYFSTN